MWSSVLILFPRILLFAAEEGQQMTPLESFVCLHFGLFLFAVAAAIVFNVRISQQSVSIDRFIRHTDPIGSPCPNTRPVGPADASTGIFHVIILSSERVPGIQYGRRRRAVHHVRSKHGKHRRLWCLGSESAPLLCTPQRSTNFPLDYLRGPWNSFQKDGRRQAYEPIPVRE